MLIVARASALPELFAAAALDVLALAVDPGAIEEREVREVRAHGSSHEALLQQWIGECLYVHEVEGFACRRIEFSVFDLEPRAGGEPLRLHAFLHGEELDPSRHKPGRSAKGVVEVTIRALGNAGELEAGVIVQMNCSHRATDG